MAKKSAEKKATLSLVVKSAVKELIKAQGCKTSSELWGKDGIDGVVEKILIRACERAKQNKRVTVSAKDL